MSKCALCGQRNVDGAIDQQGSFVCVDCFADGEAHLDGRVAKVLMPAADIFGSTEYAANLNYRRILAAYNGEQEEVSDE